MNLGRTVVAVSVDHDRLFALGATVGGDRVDVKTHLSLRIPEEVDRKDAVALGKWLGERLREAGLGRSRLVFAAMRGEVVLKRLRLPRPAEGETDLSGMVRLQMARQLTLALEGTAIDYVLLGEDGESDNGGQVSVLAGALPGDRVAWYRQVTKSAGCKLERIGLLASGAAAILAQVSQRHSGPVLGIAAGPASMEFVVVQDGHLAFARASELTAEELPDDPAAARDLMVHRAAVEAKRTWMSYRVGQDSAEIDAVVVPGEGELAKQIGKRCGDALEMQWRLAALPTSVSIPEEMPEDQRLVAAPLAGLLGERILARLTLDFAHPRKAPDRATQRRQRVLLAALVLLAIGGVGFLYAMFEIDRLDKDLRLARERGADLQSQHQAMVREQAQLGHLQQWRSAGMDWIAHTNWISEQFPDTRQARLQSLEGRLSAAVVTYTPRERQYNPRGWKLEQMAEISISGPISARGQANDREVINQLRQRLVASPVYQRVVTRGADVPNSFSLHMATVHSSPLKAVKPEESREAESGSQEGEQ